MERVSRHVQMPAAFLGACKDIVEGAHESGIDVIQPLLATGAVSAAIRDLQAYQMMDDPSEANVNSIQWGALWTIEVLLGFAALSLHI
jgi:hypothetical protein